MNKLKKLIISKQARIAVIGAGYVGLPLAVEFARKGFKCSCFEVDKSKIQKLNKGISYIDDVPSKQLKFLTTNKLITAEEDFTKLKNCDIILICVPTPLRKTKDPDVSYILDAAQKITKTLRKGQLIVLESTTYPGTTQELIKPLFEEKGFKCGKDFFLAFSPERVDPGNKKYTISNTPKVVGGITAVCGQLAEILYSAIVDRVIKVSNSESAELVKLVENTFRAVNIALVNEMALMCDKLKLDVWEVLEAAASKPFGYMPFYPGPGIGGHCIPLDPHYLSWKMKMLKFEPRFIELAGAVNSAMPEHTVTKLSKILNLKRKTLNGSKILIMGVAYKADISDYRESPALDIISLLIKSQAKVDFYDPYVSCLKSGKQKLNSINFTSQNIKKYDCVVIITAHTNIDYKILVKNAKVIFDTKNVLKNIKSSKIYKL